MQNPGGKVIVFSAPRGYHFPFLFELLQVQIYDTPMVAIRVFQVSDLHKHFIDHRCRLSTACRQAHFNHLINPANGPYLIKQRMAIHLPATAAWIRHWLMFAGGDARSQKTEVIRHHSSL